MRSADLAALPCRKIRLAATPPHTSRSPLEGQQQHVTQTLQARPSQQVCRGTPASCGLCPLFELLKGEVLRHGKMANAVCTPMQACPWQPMVPSSRADHGVQTSCVRQTGFWRMLEAVTALQRPAGASWPCSWWALFGRACRRWSELDSVLLVLLGTRCRNVGF